ncbi:MAG: hypothetical protein KDA53_08035 [Hyphomonas sp.]|nr:hypothetical protein [Hyphomonas sp.]
MQVVNRDIFPTDATMARFARVSALLKNEQIDSAFNRHEEEAVRGKRAFHSLGRASILLIAVSTIYSVAEALVMQQFSGQLYVSVLMALAAAVGIGLQVFLLASRARSRWLLNRFACERLRSMKFQAYAHAATAPSEEALASEVERWSAAGISQLDNELNAGMAALATFVPAKALCAPEGPKRPVNAELASEAMAAFRELRITYQERFAASELHRLGENQRVLNSSADILYLAGAGFVLLSLIAKVSEIAGVGPWADFLAVATFVAGISKTVIDNASLGEVSTNRFGAYRQDILDVAHDADGGAPLARVVARMELLALQELDDFATASKSVSYRL